MHDLIPTHHSLFIVNEYLSQCLACTACGAHHGSLTAVSENKVCNPQYAISCKECGYVGPFGRGLCQAVVRWNKPASWVNTVLGQIRDMKRKVPHNQVLQ